MRSFKRRMEGEKRSALPVNDISVQLAMGNVGERGLRNYEQEKENVNDTTQLQYQLAVFYKIKNAILKLSCLDIRGLRFDCSERKLTRFVNFKDGVLFNFTNAYEFDKYYELYIANCESAKPETKQQILKRLTEGSDITLESLQQPT